VILLFIGRERELGRLNEMYAGGDFECVIIYGRRRVGKTALIQEFIKDKRAIYFLSLETGADVNLVNFSKCIWSLSGSVIKAPSRFSNFMDALEAVNDLAADERLVLVIDEYPYLANSVRGMSSMLQAQVDTLFKSSKLFLILCGSSMSFMENQVLGYQSPLYGRRTAQFKIQPFSFFESMRFHEEYSALDKAVVYGITGGIPQYLIKINSNKSLNENIINGFFDPSSYFFEEPANLLKQELREPQMYNDVITAIATGSSRLNEISTKIGIETAVCSKYLTSLISLGIVKKESPVIGKKTKKTIYRLDDSMFRFWYRFVPQNASQIQSGAGERVYQNVEPHIPAFMGEVFEEICKQYLWRENLEERLPFYFRETGRWWGANPLTKAEQEIDIIAVCAQSSKAVFCECKWTNEKANSRILAELIEKSKIFDFKEKYYFIFSKSGFVGSLVAEAKEHDNIRLVSFDNMCI